MTDPGTVVVPALSYYANQRDRDVRQLMSRKCAPDEKRYKWSVGYSKACGYYSAGFEVPRYSGSSLNRKHKKDYAESKEALEHKEANGIACLERAANFEDAASRSEYERYILESRISIADGKRNPVSKRGSESRVSAPLCECSEAVCMCGGKIPVNRIHVLSTRSKSKVRDKATAFYRACPGRRCFVTLTFISAVEDRAAVSILNSFFTQLGKKYKDLQYLWVAERQENGNIHFHIIVNRRLPVATYNPLWVLQQYNAGLRAVDRHGNEISMEEIKKRYREKTVGKVLNPFDIKKVYGINGLSAYLTKYIVKQAEGVGFGCAAWHCSRGVSRLFTRSLCDRDVFDAMRSTKNWGVDTKTGEIFEPVVSRGAFWICVRVNNKESVLPYLSAMEIVNKNQMLYYDYVDSLQDWKNMWFDDDESYQRYFVNEKIEFVKMRKEGEWRDLAENFKLSKK